MDIYWNGFFAGFMFFISLLNLYLAICNVKKRKELNDLIIKMRNKNDTI